MALRLHFDRQLVAFRLRLPSKATRLMICALSTTVTTTWPLTILALTLLNMPVADRSATARLTLAWSMPVK